MTQTLSLACGVGVTFVLLGSLCCSLWLQELDVLHKRLKIILTIA